MTFSAKSLLTCTFPMSKMPTQYSPGAEGFAAEYDVDRCGVGGQLLSAGRRGGVPGSQSQTHRKRADRCQLGNREADVAGIHDRERKPGGATCRHLARKRRGLQLIDGCRRRSRFGWRQHRTQSRRRGRRRRRQIVLRRMLSFNELLREGKRGRAGSRVRSCNERAGGVGLARHRRKTDTATDGRQMNEGLTHFCHTSPLRPLENWQIGGLVDCQNVVRQHSSNPPISNLAMSRDGRFTALLAFRSSFFAFCFSNDSDQVCTAHPPARRCSPPGPC